MYSPALRPSSSRAAPAKKRIWSSAGGISSSRVSSIGLPVFSHSAAMSSSARASIASAKLQQRPLPLGGCGVAPALERLAPRRRRRRRRRPGRRPAREPNTSPVVGSIRSARRPSAASTCWPSMKLLTCRFSVTKHSGRVRMVAPPYPGAQAASTTDSACFLIQNDGFRVNPSSGRSRPTAGAGTRVAGADRLRGSCRARCSFVAAARPGNSDRSAPRRGPVCCRPPRFIPFQEQHSHDRNAFPAAALRHALPSLPPLPRRRPARPHLAAPSGSPPPRAGCPPTCATATRR